jgi:hypothetical protein
LPSCECLGHRLAAVAVWVNGQPFIRYAADAVIVATTTGSTAYSYSAGGPIISPTVPAFLVVPAAAHSTFNRAIVLASGDSVRLDVLDTSGEIVVEVDGNVGERLTPGDRVTVQAVPDSPLDRAGRQIDVLPASTAQAAPHRQHRNGVKPDARTVLTTRNPERGDHRDPTHDPVSAIIVQTRQASLTSGGLVPVRRRHRRPRKRSVANTPADVTLRHGGCWSPWEPTGGRSATRAFRRRAASRRRMSRVPGRPRRLGQTATDVTGSDV